MLRTIALQKGTLKTKSAAILTAVIPQVDTMLEGFNKIEVGAKMTRK